MAWQGAVGTEGTAAAPDEVKEGGSPAHSQEPPGLGAGWGVGEQEEDQPRTMSVSTRGRKR